MKLLGMDSSGLTASVAIVDEESLVAEYTVNYKKTHSQTLVPMLDEIVKMTELDLKTVDAIAIAKGPGSFTGLRIGSATAKGLGFALNIPIIEVPTTDGLAFNMVGTDKLVAPIMDAKRDQVYTGLYEFSDDNLVTIQESTAEPIEDTVERINKLNRPVIFLGDGVKVYKEKILEKITVPVSFAPMNKNLQSAASVATLGFKLYKEGKWVKAGDHVPEYLRLSQAERERNEAMNGN